MIVNMMSRVGPTFGTPKSRCAGHGIRCAFFWLAAAFVTALPAQAADVTMGTGAPCDLTLSGPIQRGNAAAFQSFVAAMPGGVPDILCLDTPGGSLQESSEIATYVFENGIGTYLPANTSCESACSNVFLLGSERTGNGFTVRRAMHATARLGVHRPSLVLPEDMSVTSKDVMRAFDVALDSVAAIAALAQNTDAQTGEPVIPVAILDMLLSQPATDMLYLDKVGQAVEWRMSVDGYVAPRQLTSPALWQACNYSIRERLEMSHLTTAPGFSDHRNAIGRDPVVKISHRLEGRRPGEFVQEFVVSSPYEVEDLNLGCFLEVTHVPEKPEEWQMTACLRWLRDHGLDRPTGCHEREEKIDVVTPLAIFPPETRLVDLTKAGREIMNAPMPELFVAR